MELDELDLSVQQDITANTYYKKQRDKKFIEVERSIKVFQTHIEVYPYKKGDEPGLEKALSVWLFTRRRYKPFAYKIINKVLYIPRGISIEMLESVFHSPATVVQEPDNFVRFKNTVGMKLPPRDEVQKDSIDFLTCQGRFGGYKRNSQYALTLKTGYGKSYCAIHAMSLINLKTMIFIHRTNIENQWIDYIFEYTDINPDRILILTSMKQLEDMKEGYSDYDVYITTHQLIAVYAKKYGWESVKEIFQNSGIGLKIFDEAHLYLENLFSIDCFTNTLLTFYLTGTLERSDRKENQIVKIMFSSAYKFGARASSESSRHIIYVSILYNSHAGDFEQSLIKSKGYFSSYRYIEYALMSDYGFYLKQALGYVLDDIHSKVEGQTLFVTPKIESVEYLADFLKSRVDKPGDVCTMYSKNTKEENTFARDAKYISSTIKSSGIGFSPKSLQALVCMEPVASAVLFKQLMGRLDRYIPGENTYFYDLVDLSLEDVRRNYEETHLPTMKLLAKDIQIINL